MDWLRASYSTIELRPLKNWYQRVELNQPLPGYRPGFLPLEDAGMVRGDRVERLPNRALFYRQLAQPRAFTTGLIVFEPPNLLGSDYPNEIMVL